MGSSEIVFDQPLGQLPVKYLRVAVVVSQGNKFFPQRAVKSLIVGIVFGCPHSRVVLFNLQFLASGLEILFKLRAVVVADARDFAVQQIVEPQQEVRAIFGTFVFVHPGVSHFAIFIHGRKDISLDIVPVDHNGIQTNDVTRLLFVPFKGIQFEFGDALLFLPALAFAGDFSGLNEIVIELVGFNHALDFPGGDFFVVSVFVDFGNLHLAVTDAGFAELDNPLFFQRGNFFLPHMFGCPGFVFEIKKAVQIIPVKLAKPFVESLFGDAVVAGGLDTSIALVVVNDPLQPESGLPGQFELFSHPPPTLVFFQELNGLGLEKVEF